jgi:hypothetical protein
MNNFSSPDHCYSVDDHGFSFSHIPPDEQFGLTMLGLGGGAVFCKVTTAGVSGAACVTECDDTGTTTSGTEYADVEVYDNITVAVGTLGVLVKDKGGLDLFVPALPAGSATGQLMYWNHTTKRWTLLSPPATADNKTYALTILNTAVSWKEVKAFVCP